MSATMLICVPNAVTKNFGTVAAVATVDSHFNEKRRIKTMSEIKDQEIRNGIQQLTELIGVPELKDHEIARRLRAYSSFNTPNFVRYAVGGNVSGVLDALLRITTKLTESYSSDILYTIRAFEDARENRMPYATLLLFTENSVHTKPLGYRDGEARAVFHETYRRDLGVTCIQAWVLAYGPGASEATDFTLLQRVSVLDWKEGA